LLLAPATTWAHDGVGASYKAKVGRYLVYVYDGYPNEAAAVEYRMVVLDAQHEQPVYGVTPQVRATRDGDSAQATVESFGNVFYLALPNPYPDRWQVRLQLAGELGRASTAFRLHGVDPATSFGGGDVAVVRREAHRVSGWLVGGIVLAVLAAGAFAAIRRRR
jgi:hypothetical protein